MAQLARNLKEKKKRKWRKWKGNKNIKKGGEKYHKQARWREKQRWSTETISTFKCSCSPVPLVIHMLFCICAAVCAFAAAGCAPNMFANGLPASCSRSSDAFWDDCCYDNNLISPLRMGSYLLSNERHERTWPSADVAPNKSTIGWLALLVGELRKGFVLVLDGDCTFACNTCIGN